MNYLNNVNNLTYIFELYIAGGNKSLKHAPQNF